MKGLSRNWPQNVHPNFAQNLGRQIFGNTSSGLKLVMLRTGRPPTEAKDPQKCSGECSERCRPETGCSGKCSGKKCSSSLFLEETQGASTFPSTSPSTPFLAGTSPSTLPSTLGGLGVLHFCRGLPCSQSVMLNGESCGGMSAERNFLKKKITVFNNSNLRWAKLRESYFLAQ